MNMSLPTQNTAIACQSTCRKALFNELQVATTSDSVVAFVSLSIREVYFST